MLEKMYCKERPLATSNRRKTSFVGHVLKRKDISCDLFMGSVYGNRGRGSLKRGTAITIEAGIKSIVVIYRLAQDRDEWRAAAVNCVPPV